MSRDALIALREAQGFDNSPLEVDLAALHVPYAESAQADIEGDLVGAARRGERVGLSGPVGAGKTSALRYALDGADSDVAPIWISVARDSNDVVTDPKRFLAHVVQSILRAAERSQAVDAEHADALRAAASDRRPLPARSRKVAGKIAAKFWVLNADASTEVISGFAGQDLDRPFAEVQEIAKDVVQTIAALGLQPVVVIDDSDAFTRGRDDAQRTALIEAFFGRTLSSLRELPCGIVVAVHDGYEALPGYRETAPQWGALQRTVAVPEVVSGHLRRILAHRVGATARVGLDEVMDDDARTALAVINRTSARRNLRSVLNVAHQALALAVDADAEIIDRGFVEQADGLNQRS